MIVRPIHEHNDRHEPAGSPIGGRFARREGPATADWYAANRNRSLYGATDDAEGLKFNPDEAIYLNDRLGDFEDDPYGADAMSKMTTAANLKMTVARKLGAHLDTLPADKVDAIYRELEWRIRQHVDAVARTMDGPANKLEFESVPDPGYIGEYDSYSEKFKRSITFADWAVKHGYLQHQVKLDSFGTKGVQLASFLVSTWAQSSGDTNLTSVVLQKAAEDAFGLTDAYTGAFGGAYGPISHDKPAFFKKVDDFYAKHGEVLRGFVEGMHAQTQRDLRSEFGTQTHVTLYRGFGMPASPNEKGLSSADLRGGAIVDVNLQPLSSFTTDFATARQFSTGTGAYPSIIAVRVPISRIVSTFRSGFGAAKEHELVVMGGRYPSFIKSHNITDAVGRSFHAAMFDIMGRYQRPVVASDVLRGERL